MSISRISLSHIARGHLSAPSLFICSASFEKRCLSIPKAICEKGIPNATVLISFNEDYEEEAKTNLEELRKLFPSADVCHLRTDDPIVTMDHLTWALERAWTTKINGHIFVDVSTFTRESLLILLRCLWRNADEHSDVRLLYSRAREYDVGRNEASKWLSQGIREVRSILGFPGDLRPSRQTHLVVMAGFEGDRAVALVTKFEPSLVSLGIADSSEGDTRNHQAINESRMREMSDRIGNLAIPISEFTFSGYDPQRAAMDLSNQINYVQRDHGEENPLNTIIAPMNTKLSTIGAALVGMKSPAIQLCYAQADLYNFRTYSEPGETVYLLELPPI